MYLTEKQAKGIKRTILALTSLMFTHDLDHVFDHLHGSRKALLFSLEDFKICEDFLDKVDLNRTKKEISDLLAKL